MNNRKKADLVIHPMRLQIYQVLANQSLTTAEIAQAIPLAPLASLYRHLRILLEAGMIEVKETRLVRGVQEKVYHLAKPPHLTAADVEGLTKEEHFHFFSSYTASLLKGYSEYLLTSPEPLDLLADQTGFTETTFFASTEEMEEFRSKLVEALRELKRHEPAADRRLRKLVIISHPLPLAKKEINNG